MPSIFPQWAQDLNTALGLLGFVITVLVMIQVSEIRRSFRSRARLPEIVQDLQKAGSALNKTLEGWPNRKNDARSHIKVAASLLQAAVPLLPREARNSIKDAQKKLAESSTSFNDTKYNNPDEAWDIYSEIQSSITHLNQSVRSLSWS
ncbi:hypothetical protein [Xanthomonas arboricola]|uniref:hypothetical protein n=1 Tax=Xanthomonas arboricola TaxID=56448 RepID=UPI0016221E3D|nr:hypothetical protein [Xanthomonas arboricola]MBB5858554.1 hypothetical protein [Xanthomonas arboricola]